MRKGQELKTILLLEDDETISFAIQRYLKQQGFQVVCHSTVRTAKEALNKNISLVLLDLNLPDGNGYDFCSLVKKTGDIPVIFLTVRDDERDIIKGLDMGADDYIVKPFQLSVLKSRINAVLRRTKISEQSVTELHCEEIRLDSLSSHVWVKNQEVILTAGEYRLLFTLLKNKNRTMTRSALLEQIWDVNGDFVNDNTLTVTMKRLRERLGYPSCIRTLRGIGYQMEEIL